MENEYDLPEILASIFLSDDDDLSGITLDDFYDFVGIAFEDRNNFASAALYNQARILYSNAK